MLDSSYVWYLWQRKVPCFLSSHHKLADTPAYPFNDYLHTRRPTPRQRVYLQRWKEIHFIWCRNCRRIRWCWPRGHCRHFDGIYSQEWQPSGSAHDRWFECSTQGYRSGSARRTIHQTNWNVNGSCERWFKLCDEEFGILHYMDLWCLEQTPCYVKRVLHVSCPCRKDSRGHCNCVGPVCTD